MNGDMRECGGLVFGTCPVVGAATFRLFVFAWKVAFCIHVRIIGSGIVGRSCTVWYSCKRVIFYPLLLFLCTTVSLNSLPACACFFFYFRWVGFWFLSLLVCSSYSIGLSGALFVLFVCGFLDTFAQCNFPLWAVVRICF